MNKNLLLEIGVEEIPARFISKTKSDMKQYLLNKFKELRIDCEDITIKATPRRLAIFIKELSETQKSIEEEYKGPARKIAFDEAQNPSKALLGFLKGKGADEKDIYFKTSGKEEYVYVKVSKIGERTENLLKDIFEGMIRAMSFPKSMQWGGKNIRFVRPIRWFLCIFGEEILNFEIEGIKAGDITKGHRFLGNSEIKISSIDEYEEKLEENFVILDDKKRQDMILSQSSEVAKSLNGHMVMDEELLEEVTYLVEYPTAFYGEFDKSYLSLPKEVIITPMKEHQRYFPVVDSNDKLINKFITVRNGDLNGIENVKKGNEKVLDARLSDALFFYNEDLKKPLEAYVPRLDTIVFQQKLGTLLDKTKRIQTLSGQIANELNIVSDDLERSAYLLKADLTTSMVFEFPELQGIMGRYYSLNENKAVGEAIYEHYLPRFAGDELPQTEEGIILSITDKIDSLAGFFAIGIHPTGSQDPYALRRQALGILNILIEKKSNIKVETLARLALQNFDFLEFDIEKTHSELMEFFGLRLKNLFSEFGIRYDVIDAIIEVEDSNPYDLKVRADELDYFVKNHDVTDILNAFSRVCNIAKKGSLGEVNEDLFDSSEEKNLWKVYKDIKSDVETFLENKEYIKGIEMLVSIKDDIDKFFDSVMVMDENPDIKENRLRMLNHIKHTMEKVADLSKIVDSK